MRIRNFVRGVLHRVGSPALNRKLWNDEFRSGRWDFIEDTVGDCVYPCIERYSAGGAILDLGCGSGNTANELHPASFSTYVGVDCSDIAIRRAKERTAAAHRSDVVRFRRGDIASYVPDRTYDVILFRESIAYLRPLRRVERTLQRYCAFLVPGGVFIVRMSDPGRYGTIVNLIREKFRLVETYEDAPTGALILVFQPAA